MKLPKNKSNILFTVNWIFTAVTAVLFAVSIYMGIHLVRLSHAESAQATADFFHILIFMMVFAFVFAFFSIIGFFMTMKAKEIGTPLQRKITLATRYADIGFLVAEGVLVIVLFFLL